MGVGNIVKTDLYQLNNITQLTLLTYTVDLFIEILRDEFSKDSFYHYVKDDFGFAQTPGLLNQVQEAGLQDDLTTRIFIGDAFHYNQVFYPAIIIRTGSFQEKPLSFNRNEWVVENKIIKIEDGYGHSKDFLLPDYYHQAGAVEGSIEIAVEATSTVERNEIVDLVFSILRISRFRDFLSNGVFIKPISIGSPSEADDRSGKIYKQTISAPTRSEWARTIPINSFVSVFNFCLEFGYFDSLGNFTAEAVNQFPIDASNV